jgi:diaminopimelate decarboxylase
MKKSFEIPLNVERAIRLFLLLEDGPFYLYDTKEIRATCRKFRALPYPGTRSHFACMANGNPEFLRIIRQEGLNVFVNSMEHLHTAVKCGFTGEQIVFAASAMERRSMRNVRETGAIVILDSLGQVDLWQRICPGARFGIRCNIGGMVEARKTRGGYFIGKESRLGLIPEEIATLEGNPYVAGLHLYVGTDICSVPYFQQCYRALGEFAPGFPMLQFMDYGGGFGLEDDEGEEFDFGGYGQMAAGVMRELSAKLGRQVRMLIEPGRIIGGRAGYFVSRVTDVKFREGRQLVGVNASSVQFPRPLFYPDSARHPATLLHADQWGNGAPGMPSAVYGCSTYSRDFLARDLMLPKAEIGDIIVLGQAGSYCATAFTHFLGFEQPKEIFDDCQTSADAPRAASVLRGAEIHISG